MFLAVFHSFSIFLCQKSKSLPVLFAQLLFFKDQWKRFDHVALYKRAEQSRAERIPHLLCRSQKMSDLLKNPIIESPTQIFSWFERIQAPDKQAKYFRIKFRFHRDIRSVSSKMLTPQCALHLWIKILGLLNPNFLYLEFFSPIMDVLTSKRILPDCSFQSNQKPAKCLILTPR